MEMDGRSSKRKRRTHWSMDAQHVLLGLWSQNIAAIRVARKNSHLLTKMSEDMQDMGHSYSPIEIKSKLHNLTNQYSREEKKKMAAKGAIISDWCLYDRVHSILGGFNLDETTSEYADDYSYSHYSSDQNSATKSEEYEEGRIEISDDGDEDDQQHAEEVEDDDEQLVTPLNQRQSPKRICLETINNNMEKVIQQIDFMTKQNMVAQKRMIKLEKERNEILRELVSVFKRNSPEVNSSFSGNGEQRAKLEPVSHHERTSADLNQSNRVIDQQNECNNKDYDDSYGNTGDILKPETDPLTDDIHQQEDVENTKTPTTNPVSTPAKYNKQTSSDLTKEKMELELEIIREKHEDYLLTKRMEREFFAEKNELELQNLRLNLNRKKKDFVLQMLFK